MNKFLLLTLSIMALGMASPALADDHGMDASTSVETEMTADELMDADAEAAVEMETCHNEHGEEVACDSDDAVEHDDMHHDSDDEHAHDHE